MIFFLLKNKIYIMKRKQNIYNIYNEEKTIIKMVVLDYFEVLDFSKSGTRETTIIPDLEDYKTLRRAIWKAASKVIPNEPLLLVIVPLGIPAHNVPGLVCDQWHTAGEMA